MHHVYVRKQSWALELGLAALAALMIIFACVTASASAEEGIEGQEQPIPPGALEQLAEGQGTMPALTDPQAAAQLSHQDLDRSETLSLLEAVFGPILQSPAGPFDDLRVERFLSDNVAVIAAGDQPASSGAMVGETAAQSGYDGPTVIESAIPLRVNGSAPADAVDLGLERTEDELQPVNPLAEVGIPQELGEGIDIPDTGIEIGLEGAPEDRAPSIIEQSVAAYPNVAEDTSFVVAPTPTGFETMSILQSANAPTSQTYRLDLPQGAELEETFDGGAIVTRDGETLLEVDRPAAIDAAGAEVPVRLEVTGDSLTTKASPDSSSQLPILVDPTFKYDWYGGHDIIDFSDWTSESNNAGLVIGTKGLCASCGAETGGRSGLDVFAKSGTALVSGSNGTWSFYVPRYFTDQEQFGAPPQSFIASMTLQDVAFYNKGHAPFSYAPAWVSGIWDQIGSKYTSQLIHGGNEGNVTNLTTTYTFGYGGDQNAKRAIAAQLYSGESKTLGSERELYVGNTTIELGDSGTPSFGTPTPSVEGWVNTKATPISFTVSDAGLGMKSMWVRQEGVTDKHKGWTTSISCSNTPSSPCPRTWKSGGVGQPALGYDPSVLPQGEDTLEMNASDAAGNESTTTKVKVKVDHTVPTVALSGAMTEQATIGTTRPRYFLKAVSSDGTEGAPQSGVAKTEIKVDGKTVDSTSAGCSTKNCSVTRGWTLEASKYSVGKHTVIVSATDAVGLTTEKTLIVELQPDTTKPTIENFGSLYNAPDGWVEQKTYEFGINAWDNGYGVTSLEFEMDGEVVDSAETSCPNGGCTEWLNVTINTATYKGGAHTAAIVVTDGAGNVMTESWTVNVNPKGEISAAEAIDTLEAIENTGETAPVASTEDLIEPDERAEGNDPGIEVVGEELRSTGAPAPSVMTSDPDDGATIEAPDGDITIKPSASAATEPTEVTAGVAAVSANTTTNVDTVTRPIFDGLMTFQSIRDTAAPEVYLWEVSLRSGQELKAIDSQHVAIFNEEGEVVLAISAEPAHDATGKEVPTELAIEGSNGIELIVKHNSASFVYPVVGGPAFESSYVPVEIYTPPPPPEEEPDLIETGTGYGMVSAPEFVPGTPDCEGACDSKLHGFYRKKFDGSMCSSIEIPVINVGGCEAYNQHLKDFFNYNYSYAWWKKEQVHPNCPAESVTNVNVTHSYCDWIGPNHQKYGAGYHISAQVQAHIVVTAGLVQQSKDKAMTVYMYGDGYWNDHNTASLCNPLSSC
jgi:hypothetical protein